MTSKAFRFAVTATPRGSGQVWSEQVRRYADLGYTSVFMPDGTQLPSPFPSLAMAHAAAGLTVGTFVAAAPLRTPGQVAWEAHTMTVLTDGHFEFGIGAGRPGVEEQVRRLGLPYGSPGERLARVRESVDAVRELDGDGAHTPILLAAGGPRSLALAGELADIVTFGLPAMAGPDEYRERANEVRARAGDRADDIEFLTNLFVVGDEVSEQIQRFLGVDVAEFRATDTVARISGTTNELADTLQRRRDELGSSYVTVNADYCEQLAPVVEVLSGR